MTSSDIDQDSEILADWVIRRHTDHVPDARRQVRDLAAQALGDTERAYEVAVCASETIGNAVRHGSGEHVRILVCADEDGLTVEVSDDGSGGIPRQRPPADEYGRGLHIVAALADRWSHTTDPDTGQLSVCFDFDLSPATQRASRP